MQKKGLSEVVTTVLIILLVLAAVIIVWAVIKPMLERSSQQMNTDSITSNLIISPNSLQISSDNNVTFKVLRKTGEGNIVGVNAILETASGQRKTFKVSGAIKELETKTITIPSSLHGITEEITQVLISAIVTSSNGEEVSSSIISGADAPAPICGDGIIKGVEQCDGTNLNGQNCSSRGYLVGTLTCTSSCTFDTSQCFDLNNGLVSYYKFDETSYSGTAGEVKDQRGRNNGTSFGSMSTIVGKIGRSASFNGIGQYISIPSLDGSGSNLAKNYSIIAWIKIPTTNYGTIFSKTLGWWCASGFKLLWISSGALDFQDCNGGDLNSGYIVPLNTWTNVAITFNANTNNMTFYSNGVLRRNMSFATPNSDYPDSLFRIGRYGAGGFGDFNGTMDEFMLFNRTLSTSEINTIYNSYL